MELHEIQHTEEHNEPAAAAEPGTQTTSQSTSSQNEQSSTDQDIVDLSNWKFFTVLLSVCSASFLAGYVSFAPHGHMPGVAKVVPNH